MNSSFIFFLPAFSISLWESNLISVILPEIFSLFVTRDLAGVTLEIKGPSYGKILVKKEIFVDVYIWEFLSIYFPFFWFRKAQYNTRTMVLTVRLFKKFSEKLDLSVHPQSLMYIHFFKNVVKIIWI